MRVAIIGSGLSALGFFKGTLEAGHKPKILQISGSKDFSEVINGFKTLTHSTKPGGLGNYWHGVFPLSLYCERSFNEFAQHFDGLSVDSPPYLDGIGVLRSPLRPARQLPTVKTIPNLNIIEIAKSYDVVFLGAGVFGNLSLISEAIGPFEQCINDHYVEYSGLTEYYCPEISLFSGGYYKRVFTSSASNDARPRLVIPRKVFLNDKDRLEEYANLKFSYSTEKRNIYRNLFLSKFRFARILEAVDNKYGVISRYFPSGLHFNYEQRFVESAYRVHADKGMVRFINRAATTGVPAIHYTCDLMTDVMANLPDNIIVQPTCQFTSFFSGFEHEHITVRSMFHAYKQALSL